MSLILASASPRRAGLLEQMGLVFRIVPSELDEGKPMLPIEEWVQELSKAKALSVQAGIGDIVLAADTVVVLEDKVLGKPESEQAAIEMLEFLSGRMHYVVTGICVVYRPENTKEKNIQIYQDFELTKVYFRKLSLHEIKTYVKSGEPLDKAGSYGIQGLGALFVEKMEGCYYNIVGLPLVKTMYLLRKCGINILGDT